MLTIKELKDMNPGIFRTGTGLILHPWPDEARENVIDGKYAEVNWVAVRGGIHDWTIYHSLDANLTKRDYLDGFEHLMATNERIRNWGTKVRREEEIKRLVPCDDEAFKMYRY